MIKIDYTKIETSRSQLRALLQESLEIPNPLTQSKGKSKNTEKKIISLLLQIYNEDLPALINSSEQLLAAISESFQNADQAAQSSFEK